MSSKSETDVQLIAKQTSWHILLNSILGFFFALIGISAFMSAIMEPPPPESNLYSIVWAIIIFVVALALLRNKIMRLIFKIIPRSDFLSLVYSGKAVTYTMAIVVLSFFIIGMISINAELVLVSIGLFFIFTIMYFIFSEPLTHAGETKILFELLFTHLDDFENRQQWLRTVSKKVENQLKMGNIKVPRDHFVYYFNMQLLKGTDVRNDLRSIETWIADKKTPCFDSLKKIYPEEKIEPYAKIPVSKRLIENPMLIKYVCISILAIILIVLRPELVSEFLKLFGF